VTRYAQDTSVSVARSRAEIEETVTRYGAASFASGMNGSRAMVMFEACGRRVLFQLPLPDRDSFATYEVRIGHGSATRTKTRTTEDQTKAWEQACRQRWRALALAIKAKLEAVECGITTFEEEFLAHIVLPGKGGGTVGEKLLPQLAEAYASGKMPPLLGPGIGP
jgi:hypothetical protein